MNPTNDFKKYLIDRYPPKTVTSYLYSIEQFQRENYNCEHFNYEQIADYFYKLKTKNLSSAYRIKILSALKVFYSFLMETNERKDHPCMRLQINDQRLKGIHFEDLLEPDELLELLNRKERYAILELKNKIIISFLIYQALTSEEIIAIKVNDVDLDSGLVRIKSSAKLSGRALELHRTQIMLLLKYINEVRPKMTKGFHDILVVNKTGNPESTDNIHALVQSMKLLFPEKQINPRMIRQSVIANWLNIQKIPLADVQLMAGHKWPSSTEKYLRNNLAERKKLINHFHPLEKRDLTLLNDD